MSDTFSLCRGWPRGTTIHDRVHVVPHHTLGCEHPPIGFIMSIEILCLAHEIAYRGSLLDMSRLERR
jgi:hypothetical protein